MQHSNASNSDSAVCAVEHMFWHGSIGGDRWVEHVAAARAGGFTCLAIDPRTFLEASKDGLSAQDVTEVARRAGLSVAQLDIVTNWAVPANSADRPPSLARFDVELDECFAMLDALGLTAINAIPAFQIGTMALSQIVDSFGALCQRAARHGARVDLEFMPFWGVPDLGMAWDILRQAGQPNGGILLDTWHFCRGNPDWSLLEALPGDLIVNLQLADGSARQAGPDLYADNKVNRTFVGEGELPIDRVLRVLADKGSLRRVGPEIFGTAATALDTNKAGAHAARGSLAAIERAGLVIQPLA